jgi:hypothetical protein
LEVKFYVAICSDLSILRSLKSSLSYPTASGALRRTILQINKHFIFAVWTPQGLYHKLKKRELILYQLTFRFNNISRVIARSNLDLTCITNMFRKCNS